jgi:hypothetical protein
LGSPYGRVLWFEPGTLGIPEGALALDARALMRTLGITTSAMLQWHIAALHLSEEKFICRRRPPAWGRRSTAATPEAGTTSS